MAIVVRVTEEGLLGQTIEEVERQPFGKLLEYLSYVNSVGITERVRLR